MSDLTVLDHVALAWFAACWFGYLLIADYTQLSERSVSAAMHRYRAAWMREMMQRDLRMVDTTIIGNILTGVGFFASTTIILIGGLIAALGAAEAGAEVLSKLPLVSVTSKEAWVLKLLVMLVLFVFAFFKLAWAFRLYNNCSVLIGAAPQPPVDAAVAAAHATRAGRVLRFAAEHSNRGLRAYFFALAVLAWLLHPLAFITATSWIVLVLYRREFRSRTLGAIGDVGESS